MSRALFVTASGTEVGKTLVSCALAHQARTRGRSVRVVKPVATGYDASPSTDTALLLVAAGCEANTENITACTPWRFHAAIAPDAAAAREGAVLDFGAIVEHCRAAMDAGADLTVIEGVGGTLVPLGETRTVRDLIAALDVPAVLVSGSYLGAISHALTALESLTVKGIPVRALVISESAQSPVPVAETVQAMSRFTDTQIITVPRLSGPRPWEAAPDLSSLL